MAALDDANERAANAEQRAAHLAAQVEEMRLIVHERTAEEQPAQPPIWDWDRQSLSPWMNCSMCNGTGENSFDDSTCSTCLGKGQVRY